MTSPDDVADRSGNPAAAPTTPPTPRDIPLQLPALVTLGAGVVVSGLVYWRMSHGDTVPELDSSVHNWVVGHRPDPTVRFARIVTWMGAVSVILPTLFALGAFLRDHGSSITRRLRTGALVAAMAGIGMMLGLRLNAELGRGRPTVTDWLGAAGGPSFPSGHTTAGTIFFASAALLITARVRPGQPHVIIWALAALGAFLVGWSRVWLGVHWTSDVLAGWAWGIMWSAFTVLMNLLQRRLVERWTLLRGRGRISSADAP